MYISFINLWNLNSFPKFLSGNFGLGSRRFRHREAVTVVGLLGYSPEDARPTNKRCIINYVKYYQKL